MRLFSALLLTAGACQQLAALESATPGAIPSAFPMGRYDAMVKKSPFALATAVAPPAAPEKTFADGWFVSGLARFDQKDFVTVKSRDLSVGFSLFGQEPTKSKDSTQDGVKLEQVNWSPVIGKSTVTISKDGQKATLEFNQAEIQAAAAPSPGGPGQPGGLRPPMPNNPQMNAAQQRATIPRPVQSVVTAPAIPKPINALPQNANINGVRPGMVTGARPGAAPVPAPTDSRRRIRVINNGPGQ